MMSLTQPFAHVNAKLVLDGKEYEIEQFNVKFSQPTDYKGQPQHEIKGGKIYISLSQAADDTLYLWAKKSTMLKDGVVLFQTDLGITVLEIRFLNAYCINLMRGINSISGTKTSLVLAPEELNVNGVRHDNYWVR